MQSCKSLHCSRTYIQWVYTWHLLSVNAQTSLSMRAVSPEPSLLLHMHKMGIQTAYSISQCSDSPEHACSLARAFTVLAHAQKGRTYGIFFQSILRRDLVFMQSYQSLHRSHTYAKWGVHTAYFTSHCSDAPEHSYRLARAFTALTHTQNGHTYGIFHQSMLRLA